LNFRKKNIKNKKNHKIVSSINILIELFIVTVVLYKGHVLFIIFSPFIIIFLTLMGHGITKELSDHDKAGIRIFKEEIYTTIIKARFTDFLFFPGYYLVESWGKRE